MLLKLMHVSKMLNWGLPLAHCQWFLSEGHSSPMLSPSKLFPIKNKTKHKNRNWALVCPAVTCNNTLDLHLPEPLFDVTQWGSGGGGYVLTQCLVHWPSPHYPVIQHMAMWLLDASREVASYCVTATIMTNKCGTARPCYFTVLFT